MVMLTASFQVLCWSLLLLFLFCLRQNLLAAGSIVAEDKKLKKRQSYYGYYGANVNPLPVYVPMYLGGGQMRSPAQAQRGEASAHFCYT